MTQTARRRLVMLTPFGAAAGSDFGITEDGVETSTSHPEMKGQIMAKDKSKKATKGGDDFAKPSEAPASGGDGFKFETEDNVGELFLITPLRVDTVKTELYGDSEVVVCEVVHLNEKKPAKSEEHENVYVFGGWTRGALRGYVGEKKVLARLEQDASKSKSKNPAWVLEDGDDDDIAVAKEYLASVDPFAVKGGKGEPAEKKGKKGKK